MHVQHMFAEMPCDCQLVARLLAPLISSWALQHVCVCVLIAGCSPAAAVVGR